MNLGSIFSFACLSCVLCGCVLLMECSVCPIVHVFCRLGEGASRPVEISSNEVGLVVLPRFPLICLLALFSLCNVQLVLLVSQESGPFVML